MRKGQIEVAMEGSRILAPKKDTNHGLPTAELPARSSCSPGTQSPGGKENSPQPEEQQQSKGLGKVREAALALERLASLPNDKGKSQPPARGADKPPLNAVTQSVSSKAGAMSGCNEAGGTAVQAVENEEKLVEQRELPSKQEGGGSTEGEVPMAASEAFVQPDVGAGPSTASLDAPIVISQESSVPWGTWKLRPVHGKRTKGNARLAEGIVKSKDQASEDKKDPEAPPDESANLVSVASAPDVIKDAAKSSPQVERTASWGKWKLRSVSGQSKEGSQETKRPLDKSVKGVSIIKKGLKASSNEPARAEAVVYPIVVPRDVIQSSPQKEGSSAPWGKLKLRSLSSREESANEAEPAVNLTEVPAKREEAAAVAVAPNVGVAARSKETPAPGARLSVKSLMQMWTKQGGPSSSENERPELSQEHVPLGASQAPAVPATEDPNPVCPLVPGHLKTTKASADEAHVLSEESRLPLGVGKASEDAVSGLSIPVGRSQLEADWASNEAAQLPAAISTRLATGNLLEVPETTRSPAPSPSAAVEARGPEAGDDSVSRDGKASEGATASVLPEATTCFRPKKVSWVNKETPEKKPAGAEGAYSPEAPSESDDSKSSSQAQGDAWVPDQSPLEKEAQAEKLLDKPDEALPLRDTPSPSVQGVPLGGGLPDGVTMPFPIGPSEATVNELLLPAEPSIALVLPTPPKQGASAPLQTNEGLCSPTSRPADQVPYALAFFSPQAKQKPSPEADTDLPLDGPDPPLPSALAFFSPQAKGKPVASKTPARDETSRAGAKSRFAREDSKSPSIPSLASASAFFGPSVVRPTAADGSSNQESAAPPEGSTLVTAEEVSAKSGGTVSPPPLSAASFFSPAKAPPPRKEATGYGRVKSGLSGWREGDLLLHASQTSLFQQTSPSPPHRFSVLEPAPEPLADDSERGTVSAPDSWMSPESRGEVTPYASAHCSPISLPQSSPGVGHSRKAIWEALGEDIARHVESFKAVDERDGAIEANNQTAVDCASPAEQQAAATWQADGALAMESSAAVSEHFEEHQQVRTPPYKQASAGFGASRERMLYALTPEAKPAAPMQALPEGDARGEGDQALVAHAETGSAQEESEEVDAEQDEKNTQDTGEAPEAPTEVVEPKTTATSTAEVAIDFPPNEPPAPQEHNENAPPQADSTSDLSDIIGRFRAPEGSQAMASPSKHGVWAALLGGIKGMVTPPKVTPRKSLKASLSRKSPFKTKASKEEARDNEWADFVAESLQGGLGPPTEETRQEEIPIGEEGGATWQAFETPEKLLEPVTAEEVVQETSSKDLADQTPEKTPSPAGEPLVEQETLPNGPPQQRRSASPRTPPLASQSAFYTAVPPKPQTLPPVASEPVATEQEQGSDTFAYEPRTFLQSADFYRSSGVKASGEKLAKDASIKSDESYFDLPVETRSEKLIPEDDDTVDPILRTVLGAPRCSSGLVNYYDLAGKAPAKESLSVDPRSKDGKVPVRKAANGELAAPESIHTGPEKLSGAYPWLKDPSITLTRWLKADRDAEAALHAPVQKADKVPNWARGSAGRDGAFVGTKANTLPVSAFGRTLGDHEAAKLKEMSPRKKPIELRGKLVFSTKRQESSEQRSIWARVQAGESPKEGEKLDETAAAKSGSNLSSAVHGSWTANKIPDSQRGRSMSVTTRTSEQRKAVTGVLDAARSLTPQRLRAVKADAKKRVSANPVLVPLPKSNWSERKWTPAHVVSPKGDTWQDENVAVATRDVSPSEGDVRKPEKGGKKLSLSWKGTPAAVEERALSLRDPNRAPPAASADYIEVPTTTFAAGTKAAPPVMSETKNLWQPGVAEVDPPSLWAHLVATELVSRPLPADVGVCRCYVLREHASKVGASVLYKLYTEEGQGRQDRLLLVARHQRHVSRSEFVIADDSERLSEKEGARALVRANFMGSKYTATTAAGTNESKLVEIGYTATAASLSPTFRRMLVSLPIPDGDTVRDFALVSKMPAYNRDQKRFEISYGGRARDGVGIQQSVKNFQLVHESAETRTVLLFGKVAKDVFVMDFRHPLNATQAFAVSLSSIDSKLCCAL